MSKSLKNIGVVATATMMSRVLGLAREIAFAHVFGVSALASAFGTAFQLPNLFRRLLAEGGMTAAFVPTLNDELVRQQRSGAFALVNQVSSWLLLASGAIVLFAMALFGQEEWVRRAAIACGQDEAGVARWALAARLAVVLFPYLVFVCLAAAFSATLQTLNRFLEPALSPIWLNLSMLGFLAAAVWWSGGTDETKMNWFCVGVLIGGFLQMAVPAVALARQGWRPRLDLARSPQVKAVAALMAPTVLGSAIYLINMTVSRLIGLSLNDAAVSILNYATRLMELPIGVFAVAVSTVVFPLISRYAAEGNFGQLASAYRQGMRLILLINVPAAAGLLLLGGPIIRVLFEHGAFTEEGTAMMTPILAVYALGLPFLSFVNLVLRAFYARKDGRTPVRAALLSFAVNLALSIALMGPLSILGLAIAGNVASAVQAWYLQARLSRDQPDLAFRHLLNDLGRIVFGTVVMAVAVAAIAWVWARFLPSGRISESLGIGVAIATGVALYAGLMWRLLPLSERQELIALWQRRRTGRTAGTQNS